MWMILILTSLIIIGILLLIYSYNYDNLGIVLIVIFGMWLIIHIVGILTAKINYESHIAQRNALVETIENARNNSNNYEIAAVTNKIIEYNQDLAKQKYYNTLFVCKD